MWEAYFAALCGEIRAAGDDTHRVETVFFGGGTPSLVPEAYIAGALAAAAGGVFLRAGGGGCPWKPIPAR